VPAKDTSNSTNNPTSAGSIRAPSARKSLSANPHKTAIGNSAPNPPIKTVLDPQVMPLNRDNVA
jgi:hypothetical protein